MDYIKKVLMRQILFLLYKSYVYHVYKKEKELFLARDHFLWNIKQRPMSTKRVAKKKKDDVKSNDSDDGLLSDGVSLIIDFVTAAQKNKTWTGHQKLSWVLKKLQESGFDPSLTEQVVVIVGVVVEVAKNEDVRKVFSKTARFLCCY